MDAKKIIIAVVAAIAIGFGFFYFTQEPDLGARMNTGIQYFRDGIVTGGPVVSSSTSGAVAAGTMPLSWVKDYSQIDYTVGGAAVSLTSPSSSTLASLLPKVGDTKSVYLRNLATVTGSTTTIVAGAGVDLRMGEETGADVIINGLNNALLTFRRTTATDVALIVNEEVVGD